MPLTELNICKIYFEDKFLLKRKDANVRGTESRLSTAGGGKAKQVDAEFPIRFYFQFTNTEHHKGILKRDAYLISPIIV